MKILLAILGLLVTQGCSKSAPTQNEKPAEEVNNAATRYVDSLQMNVRQADANVNRMNRAIDKSENAINQALTQTE